MSYKRKHELTLPPRINMSVLMSINHLLLATQKGMKGAEAITRGGQVTETHDGQRKRRRSQSRFLNEELAKDQGPIHRF